MKSVLSLALAAGLFGRAAPAAAAPARPVTLEVDAREAPRRIFHAHLSLPAAPGPLALAYPKWLPGEHGPDGPIADLVGLKFRAGGKPIAWRRDDADMWTFHVDVPAGANAVEVDLDYVAAGSGPYSSGDSATDQLAVLSWNQVLLYPLGADTDQITYAAGLRLPPGWKYGSALPASGEARGRIAFAPVSLTTLVDSPVLAGAHLRILPLRDNPPVRIVLAADSDAALAVPAALLESYRRLAAEAEALFGAHHFRSYTFLLTLSDHTAHFGLEHHESSDNRVPERTLIEAELRRSRAGLLPHEMVHSWNGKYRRPADLGIAHFDQPMHGELLWVYEGLTNYLGEVLTARSGLLSADEYRQDLALTAAHMELRAGRSWRPLRDTAVAAQVLGGAPGLWGSWRRGLDYYPEGTLLWLEADTIIRRQSRGQKSLDDFCRLFHGGASGPPAVLPYTFDDLVNALGQVVPYDWRGFLTARLDQTGTHAPLGGIQASGWKLVYRDKQTRMYKAYAEYHKDVDERSSIGILIEEDGSIDDVVPGMAAAGAGMAPGGHLTAVDGRRYNKDVLRDALRASKQKRGLDLLVEKGDFFTSYHLAYAGGLRYPALERDPTAPDLLTPIIAAKAAARP